MTSVAPGRWILLAAAVVVAGCSRNEPPPPPGPAETETAAPETPAQAAPADDPFEPNPTSVVVFARNQYELEVVLHAYGPATNVRLGTVAPNRIERFEVAWSGVGEIRIRVEPATGPHLESNAVTVRPGDEVFFTVASDIGRSVLIRR